MHFLKASLLGSPSTSITTSSGSNQPSDHELLRSSSSFLVAAHLQLRTHHQSYGVVRNHLMDLQSHLKICRGIFLFLSILQLLSLLLFYLFMLFFCLLNAGCFVAQTVHDTYTQIHAPARLFTQPPARPGPNTQWIYQCIRPYKKIHALIDNRWWLITNRSDRMQPKAT